MHKQRYSNQNHNQTSVKPSIDNLSRAIYTVNRHAKTAPDPKYLYSLKRKALEKLIMEGKATKKGLHFSRNPRNSQQQSDVLILAGEYYFHIPPTKEDFEKLEHLGQLNDHYRNPKANMSLNIAKELLQRYTNFYQDNNQKHAARKSYQKPVFKKLGESYL